MQSFWQRRLLGAILLVLMGLGASLAVAQGSTDTPWQEDTSNWCDGGNVWGDGRCNTDDGALTDWMYGAGWWFQRLTEGDITPCDLPADLGGGPNCTINADSNGAVSVVVNTPSGPIGIIFYLTGTGAQIGTTCNATCQANGTAISGNDFNFETYAPANSLTNDTSTRLIIHGNDNQNRITGSYGDDTIYGNAGNDRIFGDSYDGDGSGNDTINGGDGGDYIYGDSWNGAGSSNDIINGDAGDDRLYGDSVYGDGSGNDTINGGTGEDRIYGDSFYGVGSGNDNIDGGDDIDLIHGDSREGDSSGDDIIESGLGDDEVYGDSFSGTDTGTNTCTNAGGTDTTEDCP